MGENIDFSEEELFDVICEEGKIQGIADEPAFFALIDGIIEDLREEGELGTDQNLEGHAEHLKLRFAEYQARLTS